MSTESFSSPAAGDGAAEGDTRKGVEPAPGEGDAVDAKAPELLDPDTAALRAVAEETSDQFPLVYEQSALILYEVDPEHLQAQWQLNPRDVERARHLFPRDAEEIHAELRLRRIRGDGSAELVTSVPCDLAGPHYSAGARFSLRNDAADYEAELGLASASGGWVALERSNRTQLPPLISQGITESAASIERSLANRRAPGGTVEPGDGAGRFEEPPYTGAAVGEPGEKAAASETPHRGAESRLDGPVEPALAAEGQPLHPVFPNPLAKDTRTGGAGTEGDAPDAKGADAQAVEASAPVPRATDLGAWAELPPPLLPSTAAEGMSESLLYDPRTALSSHSLDRAAALEEDLEVQAELVIYGRAAPGRVIDLYGHSLQVGSNGHFFLRHPIHDPAVLALALSDLPADLPEGSNPE
ncbi:MAG: hypothetical protein WCA32_17520 [Chromatiaceae bacterium]